MNIATQEGVKEIFQSIGCTDDSSGAFIMLKDYDNYTCLAFGPLAVATMHYNSNLSAYEALLVNQTQKGLWVVPLAHTQKFSLTFGVAKMKALTDKAVFIPNESIKSIKVRKPLLGRKYKIDIKLVGGLPSIRQVSRAREKDIPYQEANLMAFINRCRSQVA